MNTQNYESVQKAVKEVLNKMDRGKALLKDIEGLRTLSEDLNIGLAVNPAEGSVEITPELDMWLSAKELYRVASRDSE